MKPWLLAVIAASVGTGGFVTLVRGQTPATLPVLSGAYSEEQAIRGQALYYEHCLACHGETLSGLDQAPALTGPQFSAVWDGEPLSALLGRIDAMPPNRPGSLSRPENVDILAYMLWYNGLPIGDVPLSAEESSLAAMTFQAPPLPGKP